LPAARPLRHVNGPADFATAFERARRFHARGSLVKAERAYRELAAAGEQRETVLRAMVDLYMESRRAEEAIGALVALTEEVPDKLYYYALLAGLLAGLGQTDAAIGHYHRLLQRRPDMASAHFNVALLYKKEKRYDEAVASYERAAELDPERAQEVWSNLGVLYSELHQPEKAAEMYERALELDPQYVPALFNRAAIYEEAGKKEQAVGLYRQVLAIDPSHAGAIGRLVHAERFTSESDSRLDLLQKGMDAAQEDARAREELFFALGKARDDLGQYDQAFAAYRAANDLGKQRGPRYDPSITEAAFSRLIEAFDSDWIGTHGTNSQASPIFICGMFRSGSTLVEQMLAAHPEIAAGGELDCLPWLVARRLSPYPERARSASREELEAVAEAYRSMAAALFPQPSAHITDKRPDNFLYLGVAKALFPSARFVYTRRDARDNCLSIYFQHLDGLTYAADLGDTAHYYRQHERLMAHWLRSFGDDVFTVDYDALVRGPEPILRQLLAFLGVDWDDRCLDFQATDRPAKTASVWQVREALHTRSSGRWRNYEPYIGPIQGLPE
jgi:tetratricopeptide (TPR) repeat protein